MNIKKIIVCLSIISINYTYAMEKLDKLVLAAYTEKEDYKPAHFNSEEDTAKASISCAIYYSMKDLSEKEEKILKEFSLIQSTTDTASFSGDIAHPTKKTTCYRLPLMDGGSVFAFQTSYNQKDLTRLTKK